MRVAIPTTCSDCSKASKNAPMNIEQAVYQPSSSWNGISTSTNCEIAVLQDQVDDQAVIVAMAAPVIQ